MNASGIKTSKTEGWPIGYYTVLMALFGLVGYLLYVWLPETGFHFAEQLFSIPVILGLCVLAVGGVAYAHYFGGCIQKPVWFLLGYLAILPWFTWITKLASAQGINFPQTLNMLFVFIIPAVVLVYKYWVPILRQVGLVKYFGIFLLTGLINYAFFDHVVYEKGAAIGKASLSVHFITPTFLNFIALSLAAYVIYRVSDPAQFIKKLNMTVIVMTLLLSVVAIVGYPLNIMTVFIEGMMRMQSIFFHPNNFAIYQAYLILYLFGVYLYNDSNSQNAGFRWLLIGTIALGFIALLTTLCKSAIFSVLGGAVVMLFLNCRSIKQLKTLLMVTVVFPLMLGIGGLAFQSSTGMDSIEKITNRFNDNTSMEWRQKSWNYLLENIDESSIMTGHGLSAAYERMIMHSAIQGHTDQVAEVHNDYLLTLYDFGLIGWILYLGMIGILLKKIVAILRQPPCLARSLDITAIGLMIIFFICSGTSNCIIMLETPFWILLLASLEVSKRLTPRPRPKAIQLAQ